MDTCISHMHVTWLHTHNVHVLPHTSKHIPWTVLGKLRQERRDLSLKLPSAWQCSFCHMTVSTGGFPLIFNSCEFGGTIFSWNFLSGRSSAEALTLSDGYRDSNSCLEYSRWASLPLGQGGAPRLGSTELTLDVWICLTAPSSDVSRLSYKGDKVLKCYKLLSISRPCSMANVPSFNFHLLNPY